MDPLTLSESGQARPMVVLYRGLPGETFRQEIRSGQLWGLPGKTPGTTRPTIELPGGFHRVRPWWTGAQTGTDHPERQPDQHRATTPETLFRPTTANPSQEYVMSEQRVALVTGSSSGIGAAVARRLSLAGYRVAINSARSAQAGEELAKSLPDAIYLQADIADEAGARQLVADVVARYGRLDVLVNNAGTTRIIPHDDLAAATPEVWREIFDVNVIGTWQVTVAAVPHLRASGDGSIVTVSSIAGSRPAGSSIPYAVSKAALEHLTRLLAATLGPEIRVNAVAPGLIDTEWTATLTGPREQVAALAPLRRLGTVDDVAAAVTGLIDSPYTTGSVLLADGGVHLR
jgi:ketoreductase RED2